MQKRTIGHYLYDGVVLIEFAGPFQVFDVANRVTKKINPDHNPFNQILISNKNKTIKTREGIQIKTHKEIKDIKSLDILLIAGGVLNDELHNHDLKTWAVKISKETEVTGSVCACSFMLGELGLLDGITSTTHFDDTSSLATTYPKTKVVSNKYWIDEEKVITAVGYTAGIDMALHVVEKFLGTSVANETARQLEFTRRDPESRTF